MSGGFSFPPPPPPPPPSSSNTRQTEPYTRGRGRGRGRGNNNSGGRGQHSSNRGNRPHGSNQQRNVTNGPSAVPSFPPGSYVNPNFNHPHNAQSQIRAEPPSHRTLPDTLAGHKRKLEALKVVRPNKKPSPPTAPVVPSFGASILSSKGPIATRKNEGANRNTLGLTPGLSDVRYSSSDEDDINDHYLDEEALHAELGDQLTFEHNGTVMALKSAADIKQWQAERKQKFPTKARIAEKDIEKSRTGAERRRLLSAAAGWKPREPATSTATEIPSADRIRDHNQTDESKESNHDECPPKSELAQARQSVVDKIAELEQLRKQVATGQERVQQVKSRLFAKKMAEDYGTINDQGDTEDSVSEVLSVSSVLTADSFDSGSDSDESSPEETTCKVTPPESTKLVPCRYFSASGHCRDGDACRWYHDPLAAERASKKRLQAKTQSRQSAARSNRHMENEGQDRKSIFQRLVEQEELENDRLALRVIKYIGGTGFLS